MDRDSPKRRESNLSELLDSKIDDLSALSEMHVPDDDHFDANKVFEEIREHIQKKPPKFRSSD